MPETAPETPPETHAVPKASRKSRWPLFAVVGTLAAGVVFLLFATGGSEAFVYSKIVDEVMRDKAAFVGRELRVEGTLTQGSIRFREEPCEWRFSIEKNEHTMPVRYSQCIVPDTFRDGMNLTVTVQGKLEASGEFIATQVVPRCPSKYEMQERQRNGESMPHEAVTTSSLEGIPAR